MVKKLNAAAKKPKQVALASKNIAKKAKPAGKNAEEIKTNVKQEKKAKTEFTPEQLAKRQAKKAALKLKKMEKKAKIKALTAEIVKPQEEQEKAKSAKPEQPTKPTANKTASALPTPKQKPTKKPAKKVQKKAERAIIDREAPEVLAATIFVGNLPINTKTVQLLRLFAEYGPVHSIRLRTANGKKLFKHKMRKDTNSLIAFLVLKDAAAAERALALNGSEFKGNHLRVTRSTEKAPIDVKRTIFVGNLKYTANEEKLREIFSSCGEIEIVRCLQASAQDIANATNKDIKSGCKGVAYISFKSAESVGLALELNDTMLDERPIHVERYSTKKQDASKERKEAEKLQKAPKKAENGKKQPANKPKTDNAGATETAAKKKTAFQGVKIEQIKKKKNKTKTDKQLKAMAKKIAPKTLLKTK